MSFILDWIYAKVKVVWQVIQEILKSNRGKLLNDMVKIVTPIVEDVAKIDLNGDGVKEHTKEEIMAVMKEVGEDWAKLITPKLLELLPDFDLKKYLVMARAMQEWKSGKIELPEWSKTLFNLALELVMNYKKIEGEKVN